MRSIDNNHPHFRDFGNADQNPPYPHRRRMSPHQQPLSLSGYAAAADTEQAALHRRRLSQAVTRKFLGSPTTTRDLLQTKQQVSEQAKSLCTRYLKAKLRNYSATSSHKRVVLQRLASLTTLESFADGSIDVAHELRELGQEMERSHPEMFRSFMANVGLHSLPQQDSLQTLFRSLADELFREKVTWGRIVALYALAGALCMDCVKHGKPEYIVGLVQDVGSCVEKENVSSFILAEGGWSSILSRFKGKSDVVNNPQMIFFGFVISVLVTSFVFKILFH